MTDSLPWQITDSPRTPSIVVRVEKLPLADMEKLMDATFTALGAQMGTLFTPAGAPFTCYRDIPGETADFEAGFPLNPAAVPDAADVAAVPDTEFGPLVLSELPAARTAIAQHRGGYEKLGESWNAFMTAIQESGETPDLPFWETYLTEPTPDMDPDELITVLAVPLK